MDIVSIYSIYNKYPNIVTDSRIKQSNGIFFALKGDNFNGNEYAKISIVNGCNIAIIDEPKYKLNDNYILVENTLECLQKLANYHRRQLNIPILAITGTNGKTTTKELINAILSKKYQTTATKGNLNNHIGVPLTILSMNKTTEIGIVEMGANHPGEIEYLCQIAEPDFGIITNIGKAHIEGFGSFEGVKATKNELYKYIQENHGKLFINLDNKILVSLIDSQEIITYGTNKSTYCIGNIKDVNPYLELNWKLIRNLKYHSISTKLIGAYNLENVLAAICIGSYFEVSDTEINNAIENYTPNNNRSQLLKTEKNTLLLDLYNANPTSMKAAIENLDLINAKNKIAIIGDMFELGKVSKKEHLSIAQLLSDKRFNKVFVVGSLFYNVLDNNRFQYFKNVDDLKIYLLSNAIESSTILIKGSRGIHLEKIVDCL